MDTLTTTACMMLLSLGVVASLNWTSADRQPGHHPLPRARLRMLEPPCDRADDGYVRRRCRGGPLEVPPRTRTCCEAASRSARPTTACGTRGPDSAGSRARSW